ncbi:hypothetical protein [Roseivirga pacifica]|uniref:hypothetical protein n=1 Tax=Roseivirga pacifica TaxID=1267423 RepID=UPI003BAC5688
MKFKLHQLEFELEGDQDVVKEQFENFKSFITGDLLPKINVEESTTTPQSLEPNRTKQIGQAEEVEHVDITDAPSLKQIKLRDLAKTEIDWMVVYSFMASEGGNKTFTRSDIVELYKESDRYSNKAAKGLSQYIKSLSKALYIKATSDTEFIILEEGIKRAQQIFEGKSNSKSSVTKRSAQSEKSTPTESKKKSKSIGSQKFEFSLDKKLNLRPDGKESLKEFSDKYEMDSTPKQITVIVYYLKNILEINSVNGDHIYTGLDELGVRVPKSLKQIIINTKGRQYGWLDYDNMEDISLSMQGRNAIKHDLRKN